MNNLLFVTPILPCKTGHGSAIRAGIALEVLSEKHEVTVVHTELWPAVHQIMDDSWAREIAVDYHLLPAQMSPVVLAQFVTEKLSATPFEGVYVFRLAATTLALQMIALLPKSSAITVLDLDDDECSRTEKFIPLREAAGDYVRANLERTELARRRVVQGMYLSRFGVSLLASQQDRDALAARYPTRKFLVLPNVVRANGAQSLKQETTDGIKHRLLFLGSLDYLPNEDAVVHFCNTILPLLQSTSNSVTLRVVGTRPSDQVRACGNIPGVTVVGPVRDLGPEYARARVMIVPLRAGSGTRIKILEAFSYGVPVVTTSAGSEGLDLENGCQLLVADTPEGFAAACLRLFTDDVLAETLTHNAHAWLIQNHTLAQVREVLHPLFWQEL